MAGSELQEEVTEAYLGSYSYLIPNRMTGRVEFIGEDPSKKFYVLKLQPQGGSAITYYLDKQTFLPAKTERADAERTRITFYSDWREIDGTKMAFQTKQTSGDPRSEASVTVQEVRFNTEIAHNLFAKPEEVTSDANFASGQSARDIPFEINGNHIYLQGQINSKPIWFVLDTGAGSSVISLEKAKALGLKLEGNFEARGAGGGSASASFVKGISYGVAGMELTNQFLVAIPIDMLKPFEGRAMEGILGYDFINRFVIEIDYVKKVIHLYDPKTYHYEGSGEILHITFDHNLPYVKGSVAAPGLESIESTFLIDTGASASLSLNKPFVDSHKLLERVAKTVQAAYAGGVGGESKRLLGRWPNLKLGNVKIENVVAAFTQDTGGAHADPNHAGLIGGEILQRFKVIFDYSHQQMILEPNENFAKSYDAELSGLYLIAKGEDLKIFTVFRIMENSPAGEAGLKEEDVIMAIDGKSANEFTLEMIRQLFRTGDGKEYQLSIKRGNSHDLLQIRIKLRKLI